MSTKSSSPSNTTTTSELPSWAQPAAQQLLTRSEDLSNQTIPQYGGQLTAGLNDTQNQGIAATGQAAAGANQNASTADWYYQYLMGQNGPSVANPYTGNVNAASASSQYADPSNNPYLANTVAASNKQITDSYNNVTAPTTLAQFRNAGAFGGSAQQQATAAQEKQLSDSLSANTSGMYNSAYNTAAGIDSQLAQFNAGQQNQIAQQNQSLGTNSNLAASTLNNQNYYSNISSILGALSGATQANQNAGTQAGNQITAGGVGQQNSQDQLNALYQQWYNQVNQPYQQLSTLSSGLSGALGSGTGTSISSTQAGSGNSLASILGLGQLGLGAYNTFK